MSDVTCETLPEQNVQLAGEIKDSTNTDPCPAPSTNVDSASQQTDKTNADGRETANPDADREVRPTVT